MKKNKFLFKLIQQQSNDGFTLLELLVAIALSSIVVTIAGFGLITMMQASAKADGETSTRLELNRALEYIANDVRGSQTIAPVSNGIELTKLKPDGTTTDTYTYTYNGSSSEPLVKPGIVTRSYNGGSASLLVGDLQAPASFSCPSGTTSAGIGGFRVCIEGNRVATIHMYGTLPKETIPYGVSSKVFARGQNPSP